MTEPNMILDNAQIARVRASLEDVAELLECMQSALRSGAAAHATTKSELAIARVELAQALADRDEKARREEREDCIRELLRETDNWDGETERALRKGIERIRARSGGDEDG